jgi:hypothetical protein
MFRLRNNEHQVSDMSAPIHTHTSSPRSSQYSAARAQTGNRFVPTIQSVESNTARELGIAQSYPALRKEKTNQMQVYKKLVEAIVRYLMREGFTFIEAYDQVLAIGRLNPHLTASQMAFNNPSIDRESFLEFKAYNASTRLKRRFSKILTDLNA